jgi:hypothetical protein
MDKTWRDLKSKLTGERPYAGNLLGASLEDQLRIATSKTLDLPDKEINQQVGTGSIGPAPLTHARGCFQNSDLSIACAGLRHHQ